MPNEKETEQYNNDELKKMRAEVLSWIDVMEKKKLLKKVATKKPAPAPHPVKSSSAPAKANLSVVQKPAVPLTSKIVKPLVKPEVKLVKPVPAVRPKVKPLLKPKVITPKIPLVITRPPLPAVKPLVTSPGLPKKTAVPVQPIKIQSANPARTSQVWLRPLKFVAGAFKTMRRPHAFGLMKHPKKSWPEFHPIIPVALVVAFIGGCFLLVIWALPFPNFGLNWLNRIVPLTAFVIDGDKVTVNDFSHGLKTLDALHQWYPEYSLWHVAEDSNENNFIRLKLALSAGRRQDVLVTSDEQAAAVTAFERGLAEGVTLPEFLAQHDLSQSDFEHYYIIPNLISGKFLVRLKQGNAAWQETKTKAEILSRDIFAGRLTLDEIGQNNANTEVSHFDFVALQDLPFMTRQAMIQLELGEISGLVEGPETFWLFVKEDELPELGLVKLTQLKIYSGVNFRNIFWDIAKKIPVERRK